MPILDLQQSLRRLGRIRMGRKVTTSNGKERPAKLDTWRLTSPSQDLLAAAADLYGGDVTEWAGAPGTGRQWEVFTATDTLDVVIPAGEMAFSQFYELWSGGGCARRCDGRSELLTGEACKCPADPDARQELAAKGEACKPTTRLFVILARVPDLGMWHLESHGYYAAVELAGSVEVLRMAGSNLVPARLRIDQRSVKRDGQTRNFGVPVIELPTLTAHTLMTGEVATPLGAAATPALDAVAQPALASVPAAVPAAAKAPAAPRKPAPKPPLPNELPAAPDFVARLNALPNDRRAIVMGEFRTRFGNPAAVAAPKVSDADEFLRGYEAPDPDAPAAAPVPAEPSTAEAHDTAEAPPTIDDLVAKRDALVSASQNRLLWARAREAGLGKDAVHIVVFDAAAGRTDNPLRLTRKELDDVLARLGRNPTTAKGWDSLAMAWREWRAEQAAEAAAS